MSTRSIFIAVLLAQQLTGCAGYHVASTGTWITTGRTVPDWALTLTTGGDCRSQHLVQDKYLCEMPVTYNRSGFE